jgi:hypothetical protein
VLTKDRGSRNWMRIALVTLLAIVLVAIVCGIVVSALMAGGIGPPPTPSI